MLTPLERSRLRSSYSTPLCMVSMAKGCLKRNAGLRSLSLGVVAPWPRIHWVTVGPVEWLCVAVRDAYSPSDYDGTIGC